MALAQSVVMGCLGLSKVVALALHYVLVHDAIQVILLRRIHVTRRPHHFVLAIEVQTRSKGHHLSHVWITHVFFPFGRRRRRPDEIISCNPFLNVILILVLDVIT